MTDAGPSRPQHQTCSAPPDPYSSTTDSLERHPAQFIRRKTSISGDDWEATREVGSGRRISPQFLYLVPVFDSLVLSLRHPRGSGVGPEAIFTLVYTSTDISTTVTAISNFRRSIQKLESSQSFFHSSVNPSVYPSILQSSNDTTNKQPPNLTHQHNVCPDHHPQDPAHR